LKYDILHENSFDSGGFLPVFDTFFILLLIFILQIPEETILPLLLSKHREIHGRLSLSLSLSLP